MSAPRVPLDLLRTSADDFGRRLRLVGPDDWDRATPCTDWDVRALVNHVVGGNVRYTLLLSGADTAEVEATRTVDHLGDDAVGAFERTAAEVLARFGEDGVHQRVVHHVAGPRTGGELLSMRILDTEVHAWDLARAIGADERLDDDVVAYLLAYASEGEHGPQQPSFGPAVDDPQRGEPDQDHLLRLLGRDPAHA
ncbi:TIGR03086 family metal-binding protein [Nocardioides ginsengisoli]|uniref:TIGR03086 family metal-binding protein n=1 Tax=Nocardioides ginsengisoli TaxID=363868 RepID=A0ABW3VYY8_9ACTN